MLYDALLTTVNELVLCLNELMRIFVIFDEKFKESSPAKSHGCVENKGHTTLVPRPNTSCSFTLVSEESTNYCVKQTLIDILT